jgi:RNA polymerase sigma-70 factor (ECF subfamily)
VIEVTRSRHHEDVALSLVTARPRSQPEAERQARLARMIESDYRLIWRLLRRLGLPEHSVDDATQQVFLIAAERLDDIQERSERAFAFGTALRVAQSLRRKLGREQGGADADQNASALPGPDELSEQRRARETLNRLLEEMPIELRAVFVLFEIEGLTSPEIAELAGVPLGTVASRLRRARESFRTLVEQETARRAMKRSEP